MKMKKVLFVLFCTLFIGVMGPWGHAESIDEAFEEFSQRFQAMRPPPGSSVHSDYKLDQAALANFLSARMLALISKQNQELISRYEEIARKYDHMIKQNDKIIQLLSQKPGAPQ
jgi:hypothetical protein